MVKHALDKPFDQLTSGQVNMLLEKEKKLVLQEQIETSTIMPKAPILKELWKYGAIQFGYISFFLLSFPAAAMLGVAFNVAHINMLYYSFTTHIQRRDSVERSSIGVWNSIFFIMSFIALMTNMGILVFSSTGFKQFLNDAMDENYDAYTIVIILVVIEHIGFIFKFLVSAAMKGAPAWVKKIVSEQRHKKLKDNEKLKKKYANNKLKNKKGNMSYSGNDKIATIFKENAKKNCMDLVIKDVKQSEISNNNELDETIGLRTPEQLSPRNCNSFDSEDSLFNSGLKPNTKVANNKKSAFAKDRNLDNEN